MRKRSESVSEKGDEELERAGHGPSGQSLNISMSIPAGKGAHAPVLLSVLCRGVDPRHHDRESRELKGAQPAPLPPT